MKIREMKVKRTGARRLEMTFASLRPRNLPRFLRLFISKFVLLWRTFFLTSGKIGKTRSRMDGSGAGVPGLFILLLSFNFALSLVIFFGITKMNLNKISKKN